MHPAGDYPGRPYNKNKNLIHATQKRMTKEAAARATALE